ncbi:hypothetical protein MFRU_005g01030 [Monilinia fructicola]|nr:hypothetical protein MFRU_005g01030 [Monilinia fructicola]
MGSDFFANFHGTDGIRLPIILNLMRTEAKALWNIPVPQVRRTDITTSHDNSTLLIEEFKYRISSRVHHRISHFSHSGNPSVQQLPGNNAQTLSFFPDDTFLQISCVWAWCLPKKKKREE